MNELDTLFKDIFKARPGSIRVRTDYTVTLTEDEMGFLKTFLRDQQHKYDEAFRNCESDDDYTSMDIEKILRALDGAKEVII